MIKLSMKQGIEIAKAFNSINVAKLMLRDIPAEYTTSREVVDYIARWENHGYKAAATLRAMGIHPIGANFVASTEG